MLARLPSLTIIRLWAVMLLAAITLQAALPAAPAPYAAIGSAFSAATTEVALYQRGDRVQRPAVAPQPATPVSPPQEPPVADAIRFVAIPPVRLASTGPPAGDIRSWKPAPRAPPRG